MLSYQRSHLVSFHCWPIALDKDGTVCQALIILLTDKCEQEFASLVDRHPYLP